jgi:type II secretory pathway pseudopilin PulG
MNRWTDPSPDPSGCAGCRARPSVVKVDRQRRLSHRRLAAPATVKRSSAQHLGITLLELAIVLSIAAVVIFIALPTLKPTGEEATIEFAKEQLRYLHAREQEYFTLHGKYAPLSLLAKDPIIGKQFDQRFAKDEAEVNGIQFSGPKMEGVTYEIYVVLPNNGGRYKVDQTGKIVALL